MNWTVDQRLGRGRSRPRSGSGAAPGSSVLRSGRRWSDSAWKSRPCFI